MIEESKAVKKDRDRSLYRGEQKNPKFKCERSGLEFKYDAVKISPSWLKENSLEVVCHLCGGTHKLYTD